MPAVCSICRHPKRSRIEEMLLRNIPLRQIGSETGTSAWSVRRHSLHITKLLANSSERKAREAVKTDSLLSRVETLLKQCESIASAAKKDKSWGAATSALREVRSCVELLARLRGELQQPGSQTNVAVQVNVGQPASDDDSDVEVQLAKCVAEATNGFDLTEFKRLQMLLTRRESGFLALPEGVELPGQPSC